MIKRSIAVAAFATFFLSSPVFAQSNHNISTIEQVGMDMTASVEQKGDNTNSNTSTIEQGLAAASDHLSATVTQTGILTTNESTIVQDGTMNEATVVQNGTGNMSDSMIMQMGTGDANSASVEQGGGGNTNSSMISQNGGGLNATVIQH